MEDEIHVFSGGNPRLFVGNSQETLMVNGIIGLKSQAVVPASDPGQEFVL